ncbi:hypothetical protein C1I97_30755 [Streptomyces sp. NTH33]|uniref:hypothetical protein n=1 Tax=Streptomyces sp. NTH33 TaxID=1735453 RepID=UPI000DA96988|nr:hypothetical protein [Streptomyces sp. NTH33]PZG90156.1 hypothetical protein C1I97_30755 [Streptomyces sp. NTH33]
MAAFHAPGPRAAAAGAALSVPGVAGLHPGLAHRLAQATARAWPDAAERLSPSEAGVRADRAADGSGWQVEVRCLVFEGHRPLDVARNVRSRVRSAVLAHLTAHGLAEPLTVTVTVARIVIPAGARTDAEAT